MKKDSHPDPKHDGPKKESTNRHVYIEPGAKIDFVDDLKHKYEAAQSDDNSPKINQLRWTKIAAVLLFLTVFVAGYQAYLTRDALHSVQRAFITFKGVQAERSVLNNPAYIFAGQLTPSKQLNVWDVSLLLENSGTTPAEDVIIQSRSGVIDDEPPQNAFTDNPKETPVSTTVGPKDIQLVNGWWRPFAETEMFGRDLTEKEWTDPSKTVVTNQHFFAWGWVIYKDVFANTDLHVTEFCQHLTGRIRPHSDGGFDLLYANCKNHNCTDRYCPDYDYVMKTIIKRHK